MILISFFAGILTCEYALFSLFFLMTRENRKPYREAFGWSMLASLLVTVVELIVTYRAQELQITLLLLIDVLATPLYLIEIDTIIHQDITVRPWRNRWLMVANAYVPLVPIEIYAIFNPLEKVTNIIISVYIIYSSLFLIYMIVKLRRYQLVLKQEKGKKQSVKWVWNLFVVYIILYTVYLTSGRLSYPLFYVLIILTNLAHAMLLNRQDPADTTKMYAQELQEEQRKALDDFKDMTDKIRNNIDFESHVKAFELEHPGFEQRLRGMTDNKLTRRDIFLCILICEGLRSAEMADSLGISTTSVEVARHRLRDKLKLDKGANLATVLRSMANGERNDSTND